MLFLSDLPVFHGVDTDKYEKNIRLPKLANEILMLEQYYKYYRKATMNAVSMMKTPQFLHYLN